MSGGLSLEVGKSKDGVPQWDGNPTGFQEYYEMCQLWEATTPWHKRYMNGPRLATTLLDHLRACLGRPQLSELSDYLQKYFRQSKRRPGESIGDYVTRKCEIYLRARQAYHRVRPLHQEKPEPRLLQQWKGTPSWNTGRRNSWDSEASSQAAAPVSETEESAATPQEGGEQTQHEWTWRSSQDERYQGWQTGWGWSGSHSWWTPSTWHFAASQGENETLEELLPDYIQGWLLLQDSGLDAEQRNLITTAARGDYSLQRIAQELRTQWSEQDLRRRDHVNKNSGFWGELQEEADENEEATFGYDEDALVAEGMNEDGLWAMQEAAHEEQEALAILQGARKTLREAREKQKFVKMSRQYYGKSGGKGKGKNSGKVRDDSRMTCLRCGRTGHRVADCPDPPTGQRKPEEHAPFVCYAEENKEVEAAMMTTAPTTEDAVRSGMAVVDDGATKTVASVQTVESLMRVNQESKGHDGIRHVDRNNRPVFSFGNSSADQCLSTAQVAITAGGKAGTLNIHTISQGHGPILLSVSTLRALGAVIDFSEDLAVFRNLDANRIVQLQRSATGHQLVPLSQDLLHGAKDANQAVPSLKSFIKDSNES